MTSRRSAPAHEDGIGKLHADVARYYAGKIARYGPTPLGVDWSCVPTQELRFAQIVKRLDLPDQFSLNDLGCGYGAVLRYLARVRPGAQIDYLGIDLVPGMIRHARKLWREMPGVAFVRGSAPPRTADYSLASGVFNVNPCEARASWDDLVAATLTALRATTRIAFGVNFLAFRAPGRGSTRLYFADPARWREYCSDDLDCEVEIVSGYGMREFTLLARPR